jgi:hypothetical protein
MKHCPNPKCEGREKFKTISEFEDSAQTCSDCGTSLIDGAAPELEPYFGSEMDREQNRVPDPNLKLVPIFTTGDESILAIAESLLISAEIPFLIKGDKIQDLFGIGRLVAVNPITGPVDLFVAEDDAATAGEILQDLTNA